MGVVVEPLSERLGPPPRALLVFTDWRGLGGPGLEGFGVPLAAVDGRCTPTKNWYGQGESDCLIKTKHCDGRKWC